MAHLFLESLTSYIQSKHSTVDDDFILDVKRFTDKYKQKPSHFISDEESQKRDHATCNLRSLCDDDGNGFSHHFKYEIAAFLQKDSYEAKEPNDDEK